MKIIKCIAEKITEEIHDAEEYIDLATEWKSEEPEAAEVFYQLSTEEMGHAEKLHGVVTNLIRRYKETNGEPPEAMMALYNYLHKKQIEETMRVKIEQGMFKAS